MGAPSRKQIDEAIAQGLARGDSENAIVVDVGALRRLSDAELAELGVVVGSDPAPAPIAAPEAGRPPTPLSTRCSPPAASFRRCSRVSPTCPPPIARPSGSRPPITTPTTAPTRPPDPRA